MQELHTAPPFEFGRSVGRKMPTMRTTEGKREFLFFSDLKIVVHESDTRGEEKEFPGESSTRINHTFNDGRV